MPRKRKKTVPKDTGPHRCLGPFEEHRWTSPDWPHVRICPDCLRRMDGQRYSPRCLGNKTVVGGRP